MFLFVLFVLVKQAMQMQIFFYCTYRPIFFLTTKKNQQSKSSSQKSWKKAICDHNSIFKSYACRKLYETNLFLKIYLFILFFSLHFECLIQTFCYCLILQVLFSHTLKWMLGISHFNIIVILNLIVNFLRVHFQVCYKLCYIYSLCHIHSMLLCNVHSNNYCFQLATHHATWEWHAAVICPGHLQFTSLLSS